MKMILAVSLSATIFLCCQTMAPAQGEKTPFGTGTTNNRIIHTPTTVHPNEAYSVGSIIGTAMSAEEAQALEKSNIIQLNANNAVAVYNDLKLTQETNLHGGFVGYVTEQTDVPPGCEFKKSKNKLSKATDLMPSVSAPEYQYPATSDIVNNGAGIQVPAEKDRHPKHNDAGHVKIEEKPDTVYMDYFTMPSLTKMQHKGYSPDPRIKALCEMEEIPFFRHTGQQAVEFIQTDKENSIRRMYYADGQVMAEVFLHNGKANGICKTYYEDGTLMCRLPYVNGLLEGTVEQYYETGELQLRATGFCKGVLNGTIDNYTMGNLTHRTKHQNSMPCIRYIYKNPKDGGGINYIERFKNGFITSCQHYYPSGILEKEIFFKNDGFAYGPVKKYNSSGKLESEYNYDKDKLHGIKTVYYPDSGKVKSKTPYTHNNINGTVQEYYESGQIKSETPFINNIKDGTEKIYYKSGMLQAEIEFENNLPYGRGKIFYETGQMKTFAHYFKGMLNQMTYVYYPNGQIKYQVPFESNKPSGDAKAFSPNGEIEGIWSFNQGQLILPVRIFTYDETPSEHLKLLKIASPLDYLELPIAPVKHKEEN